MLLFNLFHVDDPQVRLSDPVLGVLGTLPEAVSAPNETCQWGRRSHPKNTYRWCILFYNIVLCVSLNGKFQEAKSSICFISSTTSKKCYQINEYRYKWEFNLLSHKDNCPSPQRDSHVFIIDLVALCTPVTLLHLLDDTHIQTWEAFTSQVAWNPRRTQWIGSVSFLCSLLLDLMVPEALWTLQKRNGGGRGRSAWGAFEGVWGCLATHTHPGIFQILDLFLAST